MSAIPAVVYKTETGEITLVVSVQDPSYYKSEGLEVLIGATANIEFDYVDTSTDPPTIKPIPPKPSDSHEFDYSDKTWKLNLGIASSSVRCKRDMMLNSSDWTQLPDVAEPTRTKWQAYRQALRDVTGQAGFPLSVEWPEAPL